MFRNRNYGRTTTLHDVQKIVSDLGDTLQDAQKKIFGRAERQGKKMRRFSRSKGATQLMDAYEGLKTGGQHAVENTRYTINRRPLTMLFSTLLAGVFLGLWMFRK